VDILREIVVKDDFFARESLDMCVDKGFADKRDMAFDDTEFRIV
jgi:hypothetical protein